MYVIKRNGEKHPVKFDKITTRLEKLIDFEGVDPIIITQKLSNRIYPGITTTELDILASQICMAMISDNINFGVLGARIAISNHQKNTDDSFLKVVTDLYNNKDINNDPAPLISKEILDIATKYEKTIDDIIDMERDYLLDFFGFKTLERSYLLKVNNGTDKRIVERPQHLFMRVAIGIHGEDIESVKRLYHNLSLKKYTHATPTLFNAGTMNPQMSSCYLSAIEDSIEGIFETYRDCGLISKWAGGIGIHISNIRAKGSYIRKTGGQSDGIMTLLKTFNSIARQFNQGGKRLGSFAIYIEPSHPDIFTFLDAKKNHGAEDERARDLFYALWMPDLFMERVEKNEMWSLFCPDKCKGLNDVYGEDYKKLYTKYENEKRYNKQVEARKVWEAIISSQIETGTPYILYKDACNQKSNQKNLGVIKSSNLCVSGDTMILTKKGYYPIQTLVDSEVEVWNGKEWSKTVPRKTGENQKLLTIKFSNGMDLKCTEYHKFYIETGNSESKIIEAKNLKKDMRIIRYDTRLTDDNNVELEYAYTHGLHCSNPYSENPLICLHKDKINLLNYIDKIYVEEQNNKLIVSLPSNIEKKYYVPINNSINSKIKWLEGFLDGNGYNIGNCCVRYTSTNLEFMRNVLLLLQTLGIITSQIEVYTNESKRIYITSIDSNGLDKLIKLGFNPKSADISSNKPIRNTLDIFVKIQDIIDDNIYEDTFCFNEPLEHKGIFNGILTGNCAEIIEYSSKDEVAVCNLASICLPAIIKKPDIRNIFGNLQWRSLLSKDEKQLAEYIFEGKLKLFSTEDCTYCKLLKSLLKDSGVKYDIIDSIQAEKYRVTVKNSSTATLEPFETVPQLFSEYEGLIYHLGGYDDCWKILSPRISYKELYNLSYELVENLNKVIDKNFYPIEKTHVSNMNHRPVGLGVQGLADVFLSLKLPFDSETARSINKQIFETMYFGAMNASCDISGREGSYSTFKGSPLSDGKFQFDLWGLKESDLSGKWDWNKLRERVVKNGVRNSLLIALMPTASTSQIMGSYVEAFEPLTSNLYTRRTLAGEFTVINPFLIEDLVSLELWNEDTQNRLQYDRGSVQNIKGLPKFLKDIYRTAYEIPQKSLITMSAERGPFVCQSQSLNLFFDKPDFKKLTAAHFAGWKLGLKTGSYYIRSKPSVSSQRFGMDINKEKEMKAEDEKECLNCGA